MLAPAGHLIGFDRLEDGTLFGHTDNAVWRSGDGGHSWSRTHAAKPSGFHGLAGIDFLDGLRGWAFTWGGGVYRTRDGGVTWVSRNPDWQDVRVCTLAARNADELAVGGAFPGKPARSWVHLSRDGGDTWQAAPLEGDGGVRRLRWSATGELWACSRGIFKFDGAAGRFLRMDPPRSERR